MIPLESVRSAVAPAISSRFFMYALKGVARTSKAPLNKRVPLVVS
jgi:hypothetical protein